MLFHLKFLNKKNSLHYSGGSIFNVAVGPKVEIILAEIFTFYGKKEFPAYTAPRSRTRVSEIDSCCFFQDDITPFV